MQAIIYNIGASTDTARTTKPPNVYTRNTSRTIPKHIRVPFTLSFILSIFKFRCKGIK